MDLDAATAEFLAETTKLEAEASLWGYMSELDRLCMQRLLAIAGPMEDYIDLMKYMTEGEDDEEQIFYRDYKESIFGFAVVKGIRNRNLEHLANSNNVSKGFPLTVIKQVVYNQDFCTVSQESIALVFNDASHDKGFRNALIDIVARACMNFHGPSHVSVDGYSIMMRDLD